MAAASPSSAPSAGPMGKLGDVLLGGVVDLSGSMEMALHGGAHQAQRTDSVFDTIGSLIDVAQEEVHHYGRNISVFASAVGMKNLRSDVCDLLQFMEHAKDLTIALNVRPDTRLARRLGGGRNAAYWIHREVQPHEARPLLSSPTKKMHAPSYMRSLVDSQLIPCKQSIGLRGAQWA